MGVWIDTDMGFDDIAAIMVVDHAGLVIDGVSLVFGNATLAHVCANAASAIAAFGWQFPVHTGKAAPVSGHAQTAQNILGETGIPSLGARLPAAADLKQSDAIEALSDWLANAPGPHRILALGPLTNIAALIQARPDLVARIDELVWMGGGVTRGNHTASAEFNAYADPEALAIVLAQNLNFKMVDLDLCRQVLLTPDDTDAIRAAGGAKATLLADLLGGYIDIAISRGRAAMAVYDPSAAVAFVRPDLVTFAPARIDAECAGTFTRGRTVVETRSSHGVFNAEYAVEIDVDAARNLILGAVLAEAQK